MGLNRSKQVFKSDKFDYTIEVDFQLNAFIEYIKITQETIDKEVKQIIEKYKIEADEYNLNEDNVLIYDFADHEIKINTSRLYYNSMFVMLFSFLEKKMYQLCKIAEVQYEIKLNDISGQGISKYKIYLSKVLKIDFSNLNTEWSQINRLNELRNLFVHSPYPELVYNENNNNKINTLKSIKNLKSEAKTSTIEFYIDNVELLNNFKSIIYSFLNKIYYE